MLFAGAKVHGRHVSGMNDGEVGYRKCCDHGADSKTGAYSPALDAIAPRSEHTRSKRAPPRLRKFTCVILNHTKQQGRLLSSSLA